MHIPRDPGKEMVLAPVVYDPINTAPFVYRLEGNFLCKSVRKDA